MVKRFIGFLGLFLGEGFYESLEEHGQMKAKNGLMKIQGNLNLYMDEVNYHLQAI